MSDDVPARPRRHRPHVGHTSPENWSPLDWSDRPRGPGGIGSQKWRYCDVCGQKREACRCPKQDDPPEAA